MKPGDFIYDEVDNDYGIIKEIDEDLHNVYIVYEEGGSALYCLNPDCKDNDIDRVKIIEK